MNKKIASEIAIEIILVVAIATGVLVFIEGKKEESLKISNIDNCKKIIKVCGSENKDCHLECQDNLSSKEAPIINENRIACPADAKLCPDGSSVSRSGENCEFKQCVSAKKSCKSGNIDQSKLNVFLEKLKNIKSKDFITKEQFVDLRKLGEEVFVTNKCLSTEMYSQFKLFSQIGSIGDGADSVEIYRPLMIRENNEATYYYNMYVNVDKAGNVTDFYWDYPSDPNINNVSEEQLSIFMRYVNEKDFQNMNFKGYDIFRSKVILPLSYKKLFLEYKESENAGKVTYNFFQIVSKSAAAHVSLLVNLEDNSVVNFTAIEARRR